MRKSHGRVRMYDTEIVFPKSYAIQSPVRSEQHCERNPYEERMSELGGIVVLDFGGQYTQLIARRIREQQVFSAILPYNAPLAQIREFQPAGIVLSGGPSSVYDKDAPHGDPALLAMGVPVLGICYGLQWTRPTL